jgi:hypothetical protein
MSSQRRALLRDVDVVDDALNKFPSLRLLRKKSKRRRDLRKNSNYRAPTGSLVFRQIPTSVVGLQLASACSLASPLFYVYSNLHRRKSTTSPQIHKLQFRKRRAERSEAAKRRSRLKYHAVPTGYLELVSRSGEASAVFVSKHHLSYSLPPLFATSVVLSLDFLVSTD